MTIDPETIQKLIDNQHAMQEAVNKLLAEKETDRAEIQALRKQLDETQQLRADGLVHHPEPQMSEREQMRAAESPHGLLG